MNYVGDYSAGSTVIIYFNTFTSDDPSASATITNFVNTDVHIHKGSSLTQRNNAAGITVDVDVDAITGSHFIEIDTADNTVANFFTAGSDYNVRIEGTTVDGATINAVVGSFSIENRHVAGVLVKTTIATLASQVSFTLTAGSADDDAYNGCTLVVSDIASAIQKCVGLVSDYTGSTRTVTLAEDPGIFTMAAADQVSVIATSALANVRTVNATLQTAGDIPARLPAALVAGRMDSSLDATGFEAGAVDLIWDEVLTGATHNVTNSSGRRLRQIQEAGGYTNGAVYIDTVNGAAGTTDFENGVDINPCSTLASALTIASSIGLSTFVIAAGSSITFAGAQTNQVFIGARWTLALGGQDISGSYIKGADLSGTATTPTSEAHFDSCDIGSATLGQVHLEDCQIDGTVTLSAATDYLFEDCTSEGASGCIIDTGAAVANVHLDIHRFSGEVDLRNVGQSGTDTVHVFDMGTVTINANCIGGTIDIHGAWDITDNGSSTVSLDDTATDVNAVLVDTADMQPRVVAIEIDTGTTLDGRIPAALVGGRMDSSLDATGFEAAAVDLIWDELRSGHLILGSFGDSYAGLVTGSAVAGTLSTTQMTTDLTEATDDHYNGRLIVWTSGVLTGQATDITDYAGASNLFTFTAITEAPGAGDDFVIF